MAKTVSTHPPSSALVAGKYQLIKMIGRGGMGSVWEGRHTTLGTRVAIKFIEAEYANSQEAVSRFDNEAKAAARIDSKHAIKIYDHGVTEDSKPYIVMEMLTGEPLDKRLERVGRLPLQDVARICQQVCRGLGRAHEQGIIHRDLKPENIFLVTTPDDDEEYAKVLDFGIAKIKGSAGEQLSNSTKTGAVLGTPYFMSPEQARGLRDIDNRTDLWSLGVIVFKCVTGVLPFDGESLGDLLVKICTTQIPVPSQVLPGLPAAFDGWFARALEREPAKRFATASEMSDALSYACGVSVRRPAHMAPPDPNIGNLRTAMATPNPMQSPFPGSGTPQPHHPSQSGSHQQVVGSGNYPQAQYGSVPPRASNPGATPAPAAFATQSPLTASTPRAKTSGNGLAIGAGIGAVLLVGGIVAFVALRPGTNTAAAASGGAAVTSTAQTVAEPTASTKVALPSATDSAKPADTAVATNEPQNGGNASNPPTNGSNKKPPHGGTHASTTTTATSTSTGPGTHQPGTHQPGTQTTQTQQNGAADQSGF